MNLKQGTITMLFREDGFHIELSGGEPGIVSAEIKLHVGHTCRAISKVGNVTCKIEVPGSDKTGKKEEYRALELPILEPDRHDLEEVAREKGPKYCSEGWKTDGSSGRRAPSFSVVA